MPRKKPPDDPNAPPAPKPPRQRKKKEPANKANVEAIKLENSAAVLGYDAPGMGIHMQPNGVPGHMLIGGPDEMQPGAPGGMPMPYGHPHPEYYYQGGHPQPPPSVSNPHYAPSPHQPPPPQHQFVEPELPPNPYMQPHQAPGMPPHAGTPQPTQQQVLIR